MMKVKFSEVASHRGNSAEMVCLGIQIVSLVTEMVLSYSPPNRSSLSLLLISS
jgi:hypothetical protein